MLYLHKCGTKDILGFLKQSSSSGSVNVTSRFFELFKYSTFLDLASDIFGRENVNIHIFEKMVANSEEFLNKMCVAFQDECAATITFKAHNTGYSNLQVWLARVFNRFFRFDQNPQGYIPVRTLKGFGEMSPRRFLQSRWFPDFLSKKYTLPTPLHHQIIAAYREDNQYIDKKYGLDLPKVYF